MKRRKQGGLVWFLGMVVCDRLCGEIRILNSRDWGCFLNGNSQKIGDVFWLAMLACDQECVQIGNSQRPEVGLWLGMALCSQGNSEGTIREAKELRYIRGGEEHLLRSIKPPLPHPENSREHFLSSEFVFFSDY